MCARARAHVCVHVGARVWARVCGHACVRGMYVCVRVRACVCVHARACVCVSVGGQHACYL